MSKFGDFVNILNKIVNFSDSFINKIKEWHRGWRKKEIEKDVADGNVDDLNKWMRHIKDKAEGR